jgi:UDP-N-acetylglucosamine 1-carboxyvinyltransferase
MRKGRGPMMRRVLMKTLTSFFFLLGPSIWGSEAEECTDIMKSLFDQRDVMSRQRATQVFEELQGLKQGEMLVSGKPVLKGSVRVSSAKNAMLPILAAVVLNKKPVHIVNIPQISDMKAMIGILEDIGVKVRRNGNLTTFDSSQLKTNMATCEMVSGMRASIQLLGPLVARTNGARVALPGGCPIGSRPIDLHVSGLSKLGAFIEEGEDYVQAATSRLMGTTIQLSFPSVGATENLMSAAVLAKGTTIIKNAAKEPEIEDLGHFLNSMGAKVKGMGTGTITVTGVKELRETIYEAIPDRIEASTYIIAALMTNSHLLIENVRPLELQSVTDTLIKMGAKLKIGTNTIEVYPSKLKGTDVVTGPHPDFPTDVQAQLMTLMTQADGSSTVTETVFENRFMHVEHLNNMGAKIIVDGNMAKIPGQTPLTGSRVRCTDLRASAAMVLAGLVAEGQTLITDLHHMERGYAEMDKKLSDLGVCVQKY